MRRTTSGSLSTTALAVAIALSSSGSVSAQEYHVALNEVNSVRFVSRAPLEEFEGVTNRIDGYVLLDRTELEGSEGGDDAQFYFEVDLAGLHTGIGLRDRHMRDNYLEVKQYPYATFGGRIESVESVEPGRFQVTAAGVMSIHGRERELTVPCEVVADEAGYRTHCSFQVLLTDYDIEIPKIMFLKLADEIRIELDFSLEPAASGAGE